MFLISLLLAMQIAKSQPPLGYPVFASIVDGRCVFGIQDMIMIRRRDVVEWMGSLTDKSQQIDVVIDDRTTKSCTKAAVSLVKRSGFSNIVVRKGTGNEYGGGLPPY